MAAEKKYGSGGRKLFVRTRVPAAESFASSIILLLLLLIAAAIVWKGKHFDPNLYAVRTEALKSTSAAVVGKAGTAPTEATATAVASVAAPKAVATAAPVAADSSATPSDMPGEGGAEGAAAPTAATAASSAPVKGEPMEIALPGTKPMGDTEFYNADNLFEKIDGRSPAYQNYNVQQLRCRSFAVNAAAGSYVDVYEYRFDTPVDAFGMFSLERDPQGQALDFAPDGYSGAMGYFFRQGAIYVQIIASDQKAPTLALALAIAQNRAKIIPVDDSGLAGRRKLPATGMIADSVAFVPENAQGQSALKEVFQARYKFNGAELPFFVMVATPEVAAAAWQTFQDFCAKFGKVEMLPEVNGGKMFRAQLFGKWKMVYVRGGELGGAYDAADADAARAFIEKYLRGELK